MRLAITGGGTGGHIFPALEVAAEAKRRGWDVHYFGSLRGQERALCAKVDVPFTGFASFPFYSLKTLSGWHARFFFMGATLRAQLALRRYSPSALFSTGGYSSAPVVSAARRLRIPYVLHEQNSYPGRTNVILSKRAYAVATVFHGSESYFPHAKVVRTGMPVRSELREAAEISREQTPSEKKIPLILVMGGSQGAAVLNDLVLATGVRMCDTSIEWIHITGDAHFEKCRRTKDKFGLGSNYQLTPFLDTTELAEVLSRCELAIVRSGAGAIADLAVFRIPAIYVPYPSAFGDHQYKNAKEIEALGAATVIREEGLTSAQLEKSIQQWLGSSKKRSKAQEMLTGWDQEDAVYKVISLIERAGN